MGLYLNIEWIFHKITAFEQPLLYFIHTLWYLLENLCWEESGEKLNEGFFRPYLMYYYIYLEIGKCYWSITLNTLINWTGFF